MVNRQRHTDIRGALFEIENPDTKGSKPSQLLLRNRIKSLFTAGELAVLAYLVDNTSASLTDLPSSVAARELVRLKLLSSHRMMAHSPVGGSFLTKRVELTEDGQTIANVLYPRHH